MTKNAYSSAVKFLNSLLNLLKSISDEWLVAICLNYRLFGTFMMRKCVVFILTSFGARRYDCVISTKEIFIFLSLINNSVIIGWNFLFFFSFLSCMLNTIVDILDIIQVFICVLQRYCSAPINIEISCDSIGCLYCLIIISTQSSLVDFLSEYILSLTPEPFTVLSACFISLLCCQHASLVYCVVRNALLVFKHDF